MANKRTGRPSVFKTEFVEQAEKLCVLGATDAEIADFFKINVGTLYRWKGQHPQFCEALKSGKAASDDRVERSLYHKAIGYTFDAVKIMQYEGAPVIVPYKEHVPPDTTAAIFWLKNRRRNDWRDIQRVEHGEAGEFDRLADNELLSDLRADAKLLGIPLPEGGETAH